VAVEVDFPFISLILPGILEHPLPCDPAHLV
jgi:hypothetical protein